jgi:hypothetical protein
MSTNTTSRRVIGFIAWLVVIHVLLAYGLPEWLFASLAIVLGILYHRIGAFGAVTVSLTLVVVTVAYGLALKITGLEDSIYYRPDEKYVRFDYTNNHRVYQGNVHLDVPMPHGDLRAMTTEDIAEPRRMRFHTDADGFRNERDYHGQRFVLVGDSFIAGNSNSQEDLLVTQLARDYSLDTYSLAYPGNVADYAAYVRGFVKRHGENARVLLFLFEGNDFEESRGRKASALARYGRRYYEMFSGFNTYRVTMSLYKRLTRGRDIRAGSDLEFAELGGKKMAFYKLYADVARRARLSEPEGFERAMESMRPHIERVYFIPAKYRVYSRHLKPGAALPNAQWDYLNGICQKYTLRCTDLTAPLVRESDSLLKKGEYTWWRDDTHWNRHGIAVAARVVASDLGASRGKEKRR